MTLLDRSARAALGRLTNQGDDLTARHIVITQQIVTCDGRFITAYYSDREQFQTREEAIEHGFETRGSDDFNVAVLANDALTWFGWMDEQLDDYDLKEIAQQIGVRHG